MTVEKRARRQVQGLALILLFFALLSACEPVVTLQRDAVAGPDETRLPPVEQYAARSPDVGEPVLSVVGNNQFEAARLSNDERLWYERLRHAIDASLPDMLDRAARDNSYDIGRWLFQFNHAALIGLRSTGDLTFLDDIDEVAQVIRSQLRDGWCGNVPRSVMVNERYGQVREPDGFLNFRWHVDRDHRDYCRDTGDLDEALAHGHMAMVMHAYDQNRHLESPAGIDYGERADFWMMYLREHFEEKWRVRSATTWPAMDFIDLKYCHTYTQMLLYYYFVGATLLEDGNSDGAAYLRHALRLTDGMFDVPYIPNEHPGGFIETDTPLGSAVVYSVGAPGSLDVGSIHLQACPTTYARYSMTSVLTLHLEGFYRWDASIMAKLAAGIAYFMIDTDDLASRELPFAAGVTGERQVSGLVPTEYRNRTSIDDFGWSPFAAFARWDESGTIHRTAKEVYAATESNPDEPQDPLIPASMLLVITLSGGATR